MEQFNDLDVTNSNKFHNHSHSKMSPTPSPYSNDHHINNLACSNPSMVFERASLFFNECRDMEKTLHNNCKLPMSCSCEKSDTDISNKLHWNDYHQTSHQSCCGKLSSCKPSYSFLRTNNSPNILTQDLQSDYKNLPLATTSYYNLDTIKYSTENLSNLGIETTRPGSICAFTLLTLVLICVINNTLRVSTYILEHLQVKVQIWLRYFTQKSDTLKFQKDDYMKNAVKFTFSTIKLFLHGSNVMIYWIMVISELLCKPVPPRYMNKITSNHFIEKY